MRVDYSRPFIKHLKKAPNEVRKAFKIRLDLFASNPHHPLLRNHSLTGKGCRSINITGDWRALGTHSQLYK